MHPVWAARGGGLGALVATEAVQYRIACSHDLVVVILLFQVLQYRCYLIGSCIRYTEYARAWALRTGELDHARAARL